MTIRKLLALLLCLVMLLLAVGCGETADTNDDDDDKPTKKSKTTVTTTQTGDEGVTTTDFVTTTTTKAGSKDTATTTTTTRLVATLPDDQLILGDWEAEVALGTVMNLAADESGMADMFDYGDLTVTMAYHFDENGTATMTMYANDDALASLTNTFMSGMDAYLQQMVQAGGYTSADDLCAMMNCASMDELREKMADSMAQVIVMSLNTASEEVEYSFSDGYLCFENAAGEAETYNYTLTATRLLINYAGELDEESASIVNALMPLTFKKVG